MSFTQYTLGGNYNRGEAFIWSNNELDKLIIFPKNDLGNPIESSGTSWASRITPVFGRDSVATIVYSSAPRVNLIKSFDQPPDAGKTSVGYFDFGVTYSNNFPFSIGYGGGLFMANTYRPTATTGHIFTSTTGSGWTKYSDVLPSATGTLVSPIYNEDDDRWVTYIINSSTIYYSDNQGASWSSVTAPQPLRGGAYGNGVWVFGAGSNGVVISNDNLSTFSTVANGGVTYNVHYNPYSQKFFTPSGSFNGSVFLARIFSSTDGVSWATSYNGSYQLLGQEIDGDDDGNLVCIGIDYSGGQYNDTANYLYSTDDGANWIEGTLPTATRASFGLDLMTYASLTIGDPPPGTPPPATYEVREDKSSVTENGETITWTITTTGVADGTTLYYRLDPLPTDGFTDFTDPVYNGTVTINSNTATVTRTTSADNRTEGTDIVRLLLKVGGSGEDDLTVAESGYTSISDTSQSAPPPSKAQPSVTSGSVQSGSVPLTVLTTQDFDYSFQLTNNTPYSYTVDLKFKDDFLNESAGDIFATFNINSYSITTVPGTLILPTGWDYNEAPNFNFTFLVDARTAPGTPDEIDFNISRTPFNITFSPTSGGSETFFSPQTDTPVTLSGGEPNSPWTWDPITAPYPVNSGSNQFNSSGVSVQTINAGAKGTYSWTVTFVDGRTTTYTRTYT